MKVCKRPPGWWLIGAIIFLPLLVNTATAGRPPADAVMVGTETCLECHEDAGAAFAKTGHGMAYWAKADDRRIACESCHGPGSAHVEENDPALIGTFAEADQENSLRCIGCHTGMAAGATFATAHHEVSGGCTDCHVVHDAERFLKKAEPQLCFACHVDKKAQAALPSHHPLLEGRMGCTDCHDPHGAEETFTSAGDNREKCFSCHPAKQGPFIFEHAPVNEDCAICHNPHGTVADNLLVQGEPMLCLSCHPAHFHTQLTGYDGEFTGPLFADRGGLSTTDGFKKAQMTKCTQCHNAIHGTDMSSQSITAPGSLTR